MATVGEAGTGLRAPTGTTTTTGRVLPTTGAPRPGDRKPHWGRPDGLRQRPVPGARLPAANGMTAGTVGTVGTVMTGDKATGLGVMAKGEPTSTLRGTPGIMGAGMARLVAPRVRQPPARGGPSGEREQVAPCCRVPGCSCGSRSSW